MMTTNEKETGYQGYTNRATWNVVLWVMNTEKYYFDMLQDKSARAYVGDKFGTHDAFRFCVNSFGSETPDGCYLSEVNWQEVAAAFNECGE